MTGRLARACALSWLACGIACASAQAPVPRPVASATEQADEPRAGPPPTPVTVARSTAPAKEPPLDLSDHAIQKAIADSKELMDGLSTTPRSSFGDGGGPIGQARIDRAFREAEIPSCLAPEAFRFDPPALGPITFSGFAALPFWAHAITSGHCRF